MAESATRSASGQEGQVLLAACRKGDTALLDKILKDHVEETSRRAAKEAVEERGQELRDEDGLTMLHWAAIKGNSEVISLLVKKGAASVGAETKAGRTPLHFAARRGHGESTLALLNAGANPRAADKDGVTPLAEARDEARKEILGAIGEEPEEEGDEKGEA